MRLLWLFAVVLLAGCSGCQHVAPPPPEWSLSSNCVFALGLRSLEQVVPALPPPLEVGKADLAQIKAWLGSLSLKPDTVSEGDSSDGGYHYVEADFGRLRQVFYLANHGGFEHKLVLLSSVAYCDGEADPLRPRVDQIFGKPGPPERLIITTEEGRQVTDLDINVWRLKMGVITERNVFDEDENHTICVLELWATPAWGQDRPQL